MTLEQAKQILDKSIAVYEQARYSDDEQLQTATVFWKNVEQNMKLVQTLALASIAESLISIDDAGVFVAIRDY